MGHERITYCADVIARLNDLDGPFVIVERLGSVTGLALPGGKQDSGETLSATAVRECLEETGLVLSLLETVTVKAEAGRDSRGHYVSTVFFGIASGEPRAEDGKTRVLLMREEDIRAREHEFVFDHYRVITEYLAMNYGGDNGSSEEGPGAAGLE